MSSIEKDTVKDLKDEGLETFLHLLSSDIDLPKADIEPNKISLRLYKGEIKQIPLRIRNEGRGYLAGTIEFSDNLPGFELDFHQFGLNTKTQKEIIVNLRVDTKFLESGRQYRTTLIFWTNGKPEKIPVSLSIKITNSKRLAKKAIDLALKFNLVIVLILILAHIFSVFLFLEFFPEVENWRKDNLELSWFLILSYIAIILIGLYLPSWRIIFIPIIIGMIFLQLTKEEKFSIWGKKEGKVLSERKIRRFLNFPIRSLPTDLRRKEKRGEIENLQRFTYGIIEKNQISGNITSPKSPEGVRYRMRPVVLGGCTLEIFSENESLGFYSGGEFQYFSDSGLIIQVRLVDCQKTAVNVWGWAEKR